MGSIKVWRPTIAVLGLGEMGAVHATNLAENPFVRLGLASRRRSRLRELGEQLKAELAFNSYDECLKSPEVDAVVIATPFFSHCDLVKEALRNGKKVFVEKPLGTTRKEVLGLKDALNGAELDRLMLGFQRRWDPGYSRAWEKIENGSMGRVGVMKGTSGDRDYPEKYWRDGGKESLLRDLSVHDIDLARWYFQSEVEAVYVCARRFLYEGLAKNDDWDNAIVTLEMRNGGLAQIHCSRCLSYGYNVTGEIMCEKGTLQIGTVDETYIRHLSDGNLSTRIQPDFIERFTNAFKEEMNAFVRFAGAADEPKLTTFQSRDRRYAGFKDGLNVAFVADALVESAYSGARVKVKYEDD